MINRLDYNNEDVMQILSNSNYTDEQKKELFEKYKSNLKETRRKEIINRLNELAKSNPIITQEEYVNMLKRYNDDDLSKPFEIIEEELEVFKKSMDAKYADYLKAKEQEELARQAAMTQPVVEEPTIEEVEEEIMPDIAAFGETMEVAEKPIIENKIEETVNELKPTVFEDKNVKEVIPEDTKEKGNASAIIISIIAIILGMVIMYAIIKLK